MRISEYLSITESMSSRIQRLEKMHQKSARSALEDALRTTDNDLRRRYILRAIDKYRDAEGVEHDDESLFGVYFGLACCHGMLNDNLNKDAAIRKALKCYERVKFSADDDAEGLIALQAEGDEDTEKVLKVIWGVATLGIANVIDSGIKKAQELRIENQQRKEKEMRDIAKQLEQML